MDYLKSAAKLNSDDHKVQIGCSILDSDGNVLSRGFNILPIKLSCDSSFSSIWDKKDIDIGNGVTLNKREIVTHAEIAALNNMRYRWSQYYFPSLICVVTAYPCVACAIQLLDAGIRNIIYDYNTNLNNHEAKAYKGRWIFEHFEEKESVSVKCIDEI